jgi:hypothetical protein
MSTEFSASRRYIASLWARASRASTSAPISRALPMRPIS